MTGVPDPFTPSVVYMTTDAMPLSGRATLLRVSLGAKRWSPFFGQVVKPGSPDEKDGPYDGQAEAVWG